MDLDKLELPLILVSVGFFSDPCSVDLETVRLEFRYDQRLENLFICVDPDTDEIRTLRESFSGFDKLREIPVPMYLRNAIGGSLIWMWELRNQQGYYDAVQFEFSIEEGKSVRFQFLAIASKISVFQVDASFS